MGEQTYNIIKEKRSVNEAIKLRRLVFQMNLIPLLLIILLIGSIILGLYFKNSKDAAREQLENSTRQEAFYLEKELTFSINLVQLYASYIAELYNNLKPESVPDRARKELEYMLYHLPEAAQFLAEVSYISAEESYDEIWENLEKDTLSFRPYNRKSPQETICYLLLVPVFHRDNQVGLIVAGMSALPYNASQIEASEFARLKQKNQTVLLFHNISGEVIYSSQEEIVGSKLAEEEIRLFQKNKEKICSVTQEDNQLVFFSPLGGKCLSMVAFWPADEIYSYFLSKNFWTYCIILVGILTGIFIFILTGWFSYQRLIHGRMKQNVTAVSLMESLMRSDNIALIYLNSDLQIMDATPSIMEELCGLPLEQVQGRQLTDFTGEGKLTQFLLKYAHGDKRENSLIFSAYHHIQKSKSWLYAEMKTILGDGQKQDFLLMILRSTDNILGAQTLDSILEVSQNGILVVNETGEITKISKRFKELLQLDTALNPEKIALSEITQVTLDGMHLKDLFEQVLTQDNYSQTMYLEFRDTADYWAQVEISTLRVGEELVGMLFVLTDITKYLTKEAEAYKAVRLKEDLLRTVSHGIRTPLNVIVGTSDLLVLEGGLKDPQMAQVERIRVACASLIEIMNEIVDYAGINTEKEIETGREFLFRDLIVEVMNSVNIIALKKQLNLYLDVEPGISNRQYGAMRSIKLILYNLLNCAVDTVKQGYISLRIRKTDISGQQELSFQLTLDDSTGGIFEECGQEEKENSRLLMEFKYILAREEIHKFGKELKAFKNSKNQMQLGFELPVKFLDEIPCAKVEEPENEQVLIISERTEFLTVLKNSLELMGVAYQIAKQQDFKEPEHKIALKMKKYTTVFLDYCSNMADKWRNYPFNSEQRLILLAYSREFPGSEKETGCQVLYQPICSFKLADCLNEKIIPRQVQLKQQLFQTTQARVLVVDDNEVNLLVAENMLGFFQIDIVTVESAEKALHLLSEEEFDIVFMDHLMPEMDGVEATKRIRSLPFPKNETVVIALSANLVPASIALFEEAGVSDVLAKPIEIPMLAACLRNWLPKDKILEETSSALCQTTTSAATENKIGFRLPIDSQEGQQRLLHAAVQNIRSSLETVKQASEQNDYSSIRFAVHSLKGIFLNLGISDLSKQAGILETAADKKEFAGLEQLPKFLSKGNQLLLELEQALKAYDKAAAEKDQEIAATEQKGDPKEVLKQIKQVFYYVERFEIESITEELAVLKKAVGQEQRILVHQAEDAAASFDYERVRELLLRLEETVVSEER